MVKVVFIAILSAIIIVYLKSINSEFAIFALIVSGVLLLGYSMHLLNDTLEIFNKLASLSGLDRGLFKIILKITGIGYLIEFGAGILEDFGQKSLADKLVVVGKIMIVTISLPIITSLINVMTGLIE